MKVLQEPLCTGSDLVGGEVDEHIPAKDDVEHSRDQAILEIEQIRLLELDQ
jgi:hypothetical protein